jgi:hypothetical protein
MTTSTYIVQPNDPAVYMASSGVDIQSAAGSHMFLLAGSFDTLTAVGGTQMVLASAGHNTMNLAGTSNDFVGISGGNNLVTAGSGINTIVDTAGTGDTIVMPGAAGGVDNIILSLGADAKLDFTAALQATNWDGAASDLSSYLHVSSGAGGLSIAMSTTAGGAATAVGSVAVAGGAQWDASTFMAHVIS